MATWNNQSYAIKLFQSDSVYEKELQILKDIKNTDWHSLAKYYTTTKVKQKWFGIVMPLYGKDLRKIIKEFYTAPMKPEKMPDEKINEFALKMIDWVEEIHSLGYVHWDIKPENFVFETKKDEGNIVLIDFGMAHKYVDPKTGLKHIAYGQSDDFKGTPSFSSLASLKGFIQSRRDDVESLTYILMYAATGELPWMKYRSIANYQE